MLTKLQNVLLYQKSNAKFSVKSVTGSLGGDHFLVSLQKDVIDRLYSVVVALSALCWNCFKATIYCAIVFCRVTMWEMGTPDCTISSLKCSRLLDKCLIYDDIYDDLLYFYLLEYLLLIPSFHRVYFCICTLFVGLWMQHFYLYYCCIGTFTWVPIQYARAFIVTLKGAKS